jgi:hypothetical protein
MSSNISIAKLLTLMSIDFLSSKTSPSPIRTAFSFSFKDYTKAFIRGRNQS